MSDRNEQDPLDLPDHLADLAAEVGAGEEDPVVIEGGIDATEARRPAYYTPPEERFPPLPQHIPAEPLPAAPRPERVVDNRRMGDWRHNLITGVVLLATVTLCGYYLYIWQNPFSGLNPLAPPTPFIQITTTPDPNAVVIVPPTLTPFPSSTPLTTPTLPPVTPTVAAVTPQGPTYTLADPGVTYEADDVAGCSRSVIAGTVLDASGQPVNGYRVRIIDAAEPDRLTVEVLSGSSLDRGDGGFEQTLGGGPRAARYRVQLFGPGGEELSDPLMIFTQDACDENVAVMTFVPVGS